LVVVKDPDDWGVPAKPKLVVPDVVVKDPDDWGDPKRPELVPVLSLLSMAFIPSKSIHDNLNALFRRSINVWWKFVFIRRRKVMNDVYVSSPL
jgi:hypothetical protein